jgi:dihydroorotate dehydrogenase (NAD+) catalytic subunit
VKRATARPKATAGAAATGGAGPAPDLRVTVAGIELQNPVMSASGTFGYGVEFQDHMDLNRLGALVVKTVTLHPRAGNPPHRIVETPAGMLNSIGLQNVGVDRFIAEKLPLLRTFRPPLIVNIAAKSAEDFCEVAKRLSDQEGVRALELNISCPNVAGGLDFATDPLHTARVVGAVRKATALPIIPKLSPNVTDITVIARAAEEAGADAISMINTLIAMAIDVRTRRPKIAMVTAGLSGPAIRPVAVRMVWQVAKVVKVPIVGMGGIGTAEDALEFLIAGATAVGIGTANFVNPSTPVDVADGLARFLAQQRIASVRELIGSLRVEPAQGT